MGRGNENTRSEAGRSRRQKSSVNSIYIDDSKLALPRTGKKKSQTRRRIITMIVAECFALLFIFTYGFIARRWNMIQRVDDWVAEEIENPNFSVDLPQYQKQKGHWGIYIFGVDSRGLNVGKGTNADVNIVCDINHDTGEIRLVSVFRDTYLNINEEGSYNKINQAYFIGGPTMAAKMLNKNLDLNISDFVTFNWKAVADGINLLGGVDMEISPAEFYYINSFITETVEATGVYSQHLKQAGMNHLDGVQAVAYGRLRLMDTDFARTERQRKVIQAAFEKAKQADLVTLNQLILVLFPQVATSIDMQDVISLLGDVGKYYIGETGGFPFARGDKSMGKKGACVIPQTLESNVMELHKFLYGEDNYVLSDTVQKLSARISSDTGMYSQGVSVGHVSTSGGVIPSATRAVRNTEAAETKARKEPEEETREGAESLEESGSVRRDNEEETVEIRKELEEENTRPNQTSGIEPSRVEVPGSKTTRVEVPGRTEIPEDGSSRTEAPGSGSSRIEVPGSKSSQTEAPGSGSSRIEVPGSKSSQTEAPESGGSRIEVPGSGSSQTEAPGNGSSQTEAPGSGVAPGSGSSRVEVPGSGSSRVEVPGSGSSRVEVPGSGASAAEAGPGAGTRPSETAGAAEAGPGASPASGEGPASSPETAAPAPTEGITTIPAGPGIS